MNEPIYELHDWRFVPSAHARGPWGPDSQHGGAPAALLARQIERVDPGSDMFVARVTYEFLGPVPLTPLVADAWINRPGKRFQLVEAELRAGRRAVVRARAVRLRRGDVELPAAASDAGPMPCAGPEEATDPRFPWPHRDEPGFYTTGMDVRFADGAGQGGGPSLTWFRFARPLIAGEQPSPLQRVVAAADFGNGVSSVLEFTEHVFVNTDLTVHLVREPVGEWVLLEARTVVDRGGAGLSGSRLFDERGAIGLGAQTLYVDSR